jgi:enoyl-CoA hydratase
MLYMLIMEHITLEIENSIALLKVNRPLVLNALNTALLNELKHFLETVALREEIKAVILTGEGEKAFIAGADIKEMATFTPEKMLNFCELGQNVANILETAPFVTIAAVNGYALGGGLEMALACDFIYASKTALLGLPEVKLGLIPGFGGTQRLTNAIGSRAAKEMMMTGKKISADEGKTLGLINKVCEPDTLIKECKDIANLIVNHSFPAVLGVKNAINSGRHLNYTSAFEMERNICAGCFNTVERQKAMNSFLKG